MYQPKPSENFPPPSAPFQMGIPIEPPPIQGMRPSQPQMWSSGLCDCAQDCGTCCSTCFCPCITFGRIAEIVDHGSTSCGISGGIYALLAYLTCCQCVYACTYRSKMRGEYMLPESPCNDCLVHCCCEPCALSQEYRELQSRGFDMSIGWNGNLERNARMAMQAPPVQNGMMW
ncbi:hypothetical protein LUZ60_003164 [Juncus effusus]|nr:hypothetical protein LUZ60_003164 [Juncus effusus]